MVDINAGIYRDDPEPDPEVITPLHRPQRTVLRIPITAVRRNPWLASLPRFGYANKRADWDGLLKIRDEVYGTEKRRQISDLAVRDAVDRRPGTKVFVTYDAYGNVTGTVRIGDVPAGYVPQAAGIEVLRLGFGSRLIVRAAARGDQRIFAALVIAMYLHARHRYDAILVDAPPGLARVYARRVGLRPVVAPLIESEDQLTVLMAFAMASIPPGSLLAAVAAERPTTRAVGVAGLVGDPRRAPALVDPEQVLERLGPRTRLAAPVGSFLSRIDGELLTLIAHQSIILRVKAGQLIRSQQLVEREIMVVLRGEVRVGDSRRRGGDVVAEDANLGTAGRSCAGDIVAAKDSELLVIPEHLPDRLAANEADARHAYALVRELARQLADRRAPAA